MYGPGPDHWRWHGDSSTKVNAWAISRAGWNVHRTGPALEVSGRASRALCGGGWEHPQWEKKESLKTLLDRRLSLV